MNIFDRIKIYNQLMDEKKEKAKEEAKKRKPIVKLTSLEKTAVHTPTQEDYDTLMQIYGCGGWRWAGGSLPTSKDYWKSYKERTCIGAGYEYGSLFDEEKERGKFRYNPRYSYLEDKWKVISTQEFYKKQKITKSMIKEIKDYFENKNSKKEEKWKI